jgi:hypothetical protein
VRTRTVVILAAIVIAMGGVYYFTSRPRPEPPEEPRAYVWQVEVDDLKTVSVSLPRVGKSAAWVKHEDRYWYFDTPGGPRVNVQRWGGGIPLILSGPGANRRISEHADPEQLATYGLDAPQMRIRVGLADGSVINVEVGDRTPDGEGYYIKLADSPALYTVDHTWYEVLERLVLAPPYPVGAQQ